jgi:hypothetical protein
MPTLYGVGRRTVIHLPLNRTGNSAYFPFLSAKFRRP